MSRQSELERCADGDDGFSLLELLAVVAIIAILSAVALPPLVGYLRLYRVRAAAQEVAGELQRARTLAIARNVNCGVVFVAQSASTYRFAVEDALGLRRDADRPPTSELLTDPARSQQRGPLRQLPAGVQFAADCLAFRATDSGLRFNRLGMWLRPGASIES